MERNTVVLDLDRYHELLKLERDFESFKDENMVFSFGTLTYKCSVNKELKEQSKINEFLKKECEHKNSKLKALQHDLIMAKCKLIDLKESLRNYSLISLIKLWVIIKRELHD